MQEVLKYCRLVADPICEWTQRTTAAAANAGTPRWHVMRWLRTHHTPPCPWTIWTRNRARCDQNHLISMLCRSVS